MTYITISCIILAFSVIAIAIEAKTMIKRKKKMLLIAPVVLLVLSIAMLVMFLMHQNTIPTNMYDGVVHTLTNLTIVTVGIVLVVEFVLSVICSVLSFIDFKKDSIVPDANLKIMTNIEEKISEN